MPKMKSTPHRRIGAYMRSVVGGEAVDAFIPLGLPPSKPPLNLDRLSRRLHLAERALTRLDLAGDMVPSPRRENCWRSSMQIVRDFSPRK